MAASITLVDGTVIPIAGITTIVYANPNAGFLPAGQTSAGNDGRLTINYMNNTSIVLTPAANPLGLPDALACFCALQSVIQLSQFPSNLA